jgi:excisionase family DNA binding protein
VESEKFIPPLLKPARFARLIDASRSKVYELINSGEVRSVRIGGELRIPASELDRLTAAATTEDDLD